PGGEGQAPGGSQAAAGAAAGSATAAGSGGAASGGNASAASASPGGSTATPASGGVVGQGVAVSGVQCGPGVKQVPWSVYAGPCRGAWHGSNGGATAHGVTDKTITLFFRKWTECNSNSGFACDDTVEMLQTWNKLFNKNFELDGRQVE